MKQFLPGHTGSGTYSNGGISISNCLGSYFCNNFASSASKFFKL